MRVLMRQSVTPSSKPPGAWTDGGETSVPCPWKGEWSTSPVLTLQKPVAAFWGNAVAFATSWILRRKRESRVDSYLVIKPFCFCSLRIEETWRLWQRFLDDYSRFEDWLKASENIAARPNSSEVLYTHAKEELKKFEVNFLTASFMLSIMLLNTYCLCKMSLWKTLVWHWWCREHK